MKYSVKPAGDSVIIITIESEIMQEDVEGLKNALIELLEKGHQKVVLDMSGCEYITSMGLSAIFGAKKRFSSAGGDIKIAGINKLIRNLFELTNLTKKISIFDQIEDAVKSF